MNVCYGKVAYDAYRNHTGGVSLVSFHPIPEWDALSAEIRNAWVAAAKAVREEKGEPSEHRSVDA